MPKQTIRDIDIKGKRVLMRVDFNVPTDEAGQITDDSRIAKSLPTIEYAIKQGAKIILTSHFGRPKDAPDPKYSLKQAAKRLGELLKKPVRFADDCIGPDVEKAVTALKGGEVILLENVRFHKEETKNDPAFAKALAKLGDIFVSDAFGSVHRAHASVSGVAQYLPSVAGLLLEKEIKYFEGILSNPAKPFIAILGGAKVHDKIQVIENLLVRVDTLLIGGGMSYTFQKVLGRSIGNSLFDQTGEQTARDVLRKAKEKNIKVLLPVDYRVADKFDANARSKISSADIEPGWSGLDIGPKTIALFQGELKKAKTILWNGPVGVFEFPAFAEGTRKLAETLVQLKSATTVIGGGDTAAAIKDFGLEDKMSHVSTGGGASLEYLEGKTLPGIAVLQDKTEAVYR